MGFRQDIWAFPFPHTRFFSVWLFEIIKHSSYALPSRSCEFTTNVYKSSVMDALRSEYRTLTSCQDRFLFQHWRRHANPTWNVCPTPFAEITPRQRIPDWRFVCAKKDSPRKKRPAIVIIYSICFLRKIASISTRRAFKVFFVFDDDSRTRIFL